MSTDNSALLKAQLELFNNQVAELAKAERITKRVLGELSRSSLQMYLDFGVVQPINTLMGMHKHEDGKEMFVLTPANWKAAANYFTSFIPHEYNKKEVDDFITGATRNREALEFGKKNNKRAESIVTFDFPIHKAVASDESLAALTKKELCAEIITRWLADESNNIWTFVADTDQGDDRQTDYGKNIIKAIESAMDEKKGGMSAHDIFKLLAEKSPLSVLLEGITPEKK